MTLKLLGKSATNFTGAQQAPFGQLPHRRGNPSVIRKAIRVDATFSPLGRNGLKGRTVDAERTVRWVTQFLTAPHPLSGVKDRAVCPFALGALDRRGIWIDEDFAQHADSQRIVARITAMERAFDRLPPIGDDAVYKALVVTFPALNDAQGEQLLVQLQGEHKVAFLEKGLMLGVFHPHQQLAGLHSKQFKPFQSPCAMLVVRRVVAADLSFLADPRLEAGLRIKLIQSYLQRGFKLQNELNAKKALEQARAEVNP